jgi:hypothetical protein
VRKLTPHPGFRTSHKQELLAESRKHPLSEPPAMATWALTKEVALSGEGEKLDPSAAGDAVLGTLDAKRGRRERGTFRLNWPFRGELAVPPSTKRARELVANKFGSANRRQFAATLWRVVRFARW